MNIINMLPSEMEKLKNTEPTRALRKEMLAAIRSLLEYPEARDESIFLSACQLSKIGIERFVTSYEIADAISNFNSSTTKDFLDGMSTAFSNEIVAEYNAKKKLTKF